MENHLLENALVESVFDNIRKKKNKDCLNISKVAAFHILLV
jgi:hypothetical protein